MEDAYNPAQQRVIDLLRRSDERPQIPGDLAEELRQELESALEPLAHLLPDGKTFESRFFMNKQALSNVHSCESYYLDGQEEFAWTVATSRGTIVHKAIEVSINLRHPVPPTDLIEEAIARLSNDANKSIGDFLVGLNEFDRAELIGECSALFTRFTECFPPIKRSWIPQVESSLALNLAQGRVRVAGKVDLALGKPPDKVIIDVKTGRWVPAHHDDLRLYALVDFLAIGQVPRKVASYYLDSAELHAEDLSETILRSTTRRLRDGLVRAISLKFGDAEPVLRPGPVCRWCLHAESCDTGRAYLDARKADDGW
ncbi:MAG: PD-(D/E)XK nuclease family protein [Actinomycetota bacterium]